MEKRGCLAVVAGMSLEYALVVGVRENAYYLYPRFLLEDGKAYEDIVIRFFELTGKDANYSGAARRYRAYQLERGACIPLKERSKRYPVLAEGRARAGGAHPPCLETGPRPPFWNRPRKTSRRSMWPSHSNAQNRFLMNFTDRESATPNSVWSAGTNPDTTGRLSRSLPRRTPARRRGGAAPPHPESEGLRVSHLRPHQRSRLLHHCQTLEQGVCDPRQKRGTPQGGDSGGEDSPTVSAPGRPMRKSPFRISRT